MEELLHRLLTIALRNKATDIHLSLENDERLLVEMRVDGKLRKLRSQDYDASFFRYLMFRSNLDLSLARKPQTGSFETEINGESLALRFAIVTGWHMTCGVLRILAWLRGSEKTPPSDPGASMTSSVQTGEVSVRFDEAVHWTISSDFVAQSLSLSTTFLLTGKND